MHALKGPVKAYYTNSNGPIKALVQSWQFSLIEPVQWFYIWIKSFNVLERLINGQHVACSTTVWFHVQYKSLNQAMFYVSYKKALGVQTCQM